MKRKATTIEFTNTEIDVLESALRRLRNDFGLDKIKTFTNYTSTNINDTLTLVLKAKKVIIGETNETKTS